MRSYPDGEMIPEDIIARMEDGQSDEGPDVLLHHFLSVLNGMDVRAARRLRGELTSRFGGRYCSHELCSLMIDLLNGHLAARQNRMGF